jgi:polysaccharide export outer membrane protein
MEPDLLYPLSRREELKIQPGDRLQILISSKNPELSAPFNVGVGGYQVGMDGEIKTMANSAMQEKGYTVSPQGNIEFPVLGELYVEGLTRQELADLIRERLRKDELINDAIVTVDLLNLKIIMIGEVNSVGVLSVPDGKITLLEAITMSGGLTNNAMMNEVAVIREEVGGYRMMINDLRKVEVFNSPSFYLQQNDIVYVKPVTRGLSERESNVLQFSTFLLGLGSTVVSLMILRQYYK